MRTDGHGKRLLVGRKRAGMRGVRPVPQHREGDTAAQFFSNTCAEMYWVQEYFRDHGKDGHELNSMARFTNDLFTFGRACGFASYTTDGGVTFAHIPQKDIKP